MPLLVRVLSQKRHKQLWTIAEIRSLQAIQRVPQTHQTSAGCKIEDTQRARNLESLFQSGRRAFALVDEDKIGLK